MSEETLLDRSQLRNKKIGFLRVELIVAVYATVWAFDKTKCCCHLSSKEIKAKIMDCICFDSESKL